MLLFHVWNNALSKSRNCPHCGKPERIGATKAPVLSPAFFRPPVHFQKTWESSNGRGQSLWANPMSSCHLMRKANAGVRYSSFRHAGPTRAEGSCLWATDAAPASSARTQRPTGANEGGIVGGSMTEKKGFFVDGVVIRVFSKSAFPLPIFRPLATKVGPGFCPELQPPYSWTRCFCPQKPGWSCTKNQQKPHEPPR